MSSSKSQRTVKNRSQSMELLEYRRLFSAAYTLTDLTPATGLTQHNGTAYGISNNSKIAMSYDGDAAYWASGTVHDLGITGYATDINDSGVVCGVDTSGGVSKPFVWKNGVETILSLNGNTNGVASAINANGTVIGTFFVSGSVHKGFVAQLGASAHDIGTPGGYTSTDATGINDVGQIIGNVDHGPGSVRAFILGNNVFKILNPLTGGTQSFTKHGLTPNGTTAAYGSSMFHLPQDPSTNIYHVFTVGSNGYGGASDKGTLGNNYDIAANDINVSGVIVATINGGAFPFEAAVYDGSWKSLTYQIDPSVGWTLFQANAVNDSGKIVGFGYDHDGNRGAYLLTPTVTPPIGSNIGGTIFGDSNNDGSFNAGEPIGANRTVFIDTNGNGNLDAGEQQTQSDINGVYTFSGLADGAYNISRVFPSGYHLSNGTNGGPSVKVILSSGSVSGVNLGSTPDAPAVKGSIAGIVFGDSNNNGVLNAGEPVGPDRLVFLDTNGNGILDFGERSTMTDDTGRYFFDNLVTGTYKVTRVFPSGYHLSHPSAGTGGHDLVVNVGSGQAVMHVNIGSIKN